MNCLQSQVFNFWENICLTGVLDQKFVQLWKKTAALRSSNIEKSQKTRKTIRRRNPVLVSSAFFHCMTGTFAALQHRKITRPFFSFSFRSWLFQLNFSLSSHWPSLCWQFNCRHNKFDSQSAKLSSALLLILIGLKTKICYQGEIGIQVNY